VKKRPVKSNNRLVTAKKRRRAVDPATRQLVLQIAIGIGVFSLVVLVLTGVWYGSRVNMLTIDTIIIEGGQTISHDQVRDTVAGTLTGNYFGLIPKRFAWTYPHTTIVTEVATVSRVKNPIVERLSGTELRVVIDEYIPFALWCKFENESDCFFIDREGFAFAQAPVLEGGSLYRFYTLGDEPALKEVLRDGLVLANIVTMAEALESDFSFPVTKIELDTMGDVFFHVVRGGEIKVAVSQSPQKTLENLALVLSADDFAGLKAGTFQYIDLRFGSKVFVNDTILAEASTTTPTDTIVTSADSETAITALESALRGLSQVAGAETVAEEELVLEIATTADGVESAEESVSTTSTSISLENE